MTGTWLALTICLIHVSWIGSTSSGWRYYEHYQHKGCEPVFGEDGELIHFDCKPLPDDLRQKCLHKGKWYEKRESIAGLPCDSCTCRTDEEEGGFIECSSVDCPDWEAQDKSCYMGYKLGACCPTEMCPPADESKRKVCVHNGKVHNIGQFVQSDDPCRRCICTEDWAGIDGPGCSQVDCLTGTHALEIRRGCLPIYGEKTCCATGMYCGDVTGATPASTFLPRDNYCKYQGKYYERGSTVSPTERNLCMECRCTVPPDFTCLRKKC